MARSESRGAHFRTDHPEEDPKWIKTLIISKDENAMKIGTAPIGEAFN
jgi:succinate dehydrogenase / fumarate reductase flavoprotein subunit